MDRKTPHSASSNGTTDGPASTDSTREVVEGYAGADSAVNGTTRPTTHNSGDGSPADSTTTKSGSMQRTNTDATLSAVSRINDIPSSLKDRDKDKKKGVSFLSRIIGNKKRGALPTHGQDASDPGDGRPEGMDAHLFSHSTDNVGFSPQYPQPPQYIKVRSKFKREKEIDHLFLSQQLRGGHQKATTFPLVSRTATEIASHTQAREDPVWALEFSKDGKYLAAAGHDKTVRVWAVISSPEERRDFEDAGSPQGGQGASPSPLRAPVFHPTPFRLYEGHESTVIDLSWSKNNFLLSSSFDKTVRLWHISRNECLCTFKHAEYVPSIQFHPRDDRFFLAGSLDLKLRLWSIPDKSVAFWAQLPEMITAVAFTPDGKSCIAGTLGGQLHFYETDNLKYSTHIHVRSNRGKKSRGSKITNIQAMNFPPDKPYGNLKILVSSNDSRVRLYNMRDKSLQAKFKGHVNNETQIRATFSDDGRYVVSGSEDKKTHIWSIDPGDAEKGEQPLEVFESNSSMTIASLLAPTKTRQALSASEDPIYDLCNPPPVTLVSRTESIHSSRPPTESENGQEIPSGETTTNRTAGSPAYVARNVHPGGHIIVTAEYSGSIRVYRQDCAYMKRRQAEAWDASSAFGKRNAGSTKGTSPRIGFGGLNRSGSVTTRASAGTNSGARSMTALALTRSRERRDSSSTQPSSDRILSWRQGIDTNSSTSVDSPQLGRRSASLRKGRSVSPRKSSGQVSHASSAGGTGSMPKAQPTKSDPTRSQSRLQQDKQKITTESPGGNGGASRQATPKEQKAPDRIPTDRDSSPDPLTQRGSQNHTFWNPQAWRRDQMNAAMNPSSRPKPPQTSPNHDSNLLMPDLAALNKKLSNVSTLSSEGSTAGSGQQRLSAEYSSVGGKENEEAEVRCRRCSGTSFKAKMIDRATGKQKCFVCSRCGTPL